MREFPKAAYIAAQLFAQERHLEDLAHVKRLRAKGKSPKRKRNHKINNMKACFLAGVDYAMTNKTGGEHE